MDANKPAGPLLQFGIRDLLWATALCAALLGWLLDQPNSRQWPDSWFTARDGFARVYYVGDIAPVNDGGPFAVALMQEIQNEVTPGRWRRDASIRSFDTNQSLVIVHTADGHEQVKLFLDKKRDASLAGVVDPELLSSPRH